MQRLIIALLVALLAGTTCFGEEVPRNGIDKTYWDNGELMMEITYRNGRRDGPIKQYGMEGELIGEGTYVDGKLEGPWYSYQYKDKGMSEEAFYKNGKLEGARKVYYE